MHVQPYNDPRVRYLRRERLPSDLKTASNALNFGIDYCLARSGDVFTRSEAEDLVGVGFLHSDDLLSSDSIERRVRHLPRGFVYTDRATFSGIHVIDIIGGKSLSSMGRLALQPFPHHTLLWEMEFLEYLKGFVECHYGQEGVFDSLLSHVKIEMFHCLLWKLQTKAVTKLYMFQGFPYFIEFIRIQSQAK